MWPKAAPVLAVFVLGAGWLAFVATHEEVEASGEVGVREVAGEGVGMQASAGSASAGHHSFGQIQHIG